MLACRGWEGIRARRNLIMIFKVMWLKHLLKYAELSWQEKVYIGEGCNAWIKIFLTSIFCLLKRRKFLNVQETQMLRWSADIYSPLKASLLKAEVFKKIPSLLEGEWNGLTPRRRHSANTEIPQILSRKDRKRNKPENRRKRGNDKSSIQQSRKVQEEKECQW